jgi:hypothetical protein
MMGLQNHPGEDSTTVSLAMQRVMVGISNNVWNRESRKSLDLMIRSSPSTKPTPRQLNNFRFYSVTRDEPQTREQQDSIDVILQFSTTAWNHSLGVVICDISVRGDVQVKRIAAISFISAFAFLTWLLRIWLTWNLCHLCQTWAGCHLSCAAFATWDRWLFEEQM